MDVSSLIERKLPVIAKYTKLSERQERRERLGHLAEDFIISCLIEANYVVVARDTRFFQGKEWFRRTDLDLIVYGKEEDRWYGVQIKNRLDYPEWDDIAELMDICNFLGLTPWLIARYSPKSYNWELIRSGGFVTLFPGRKWLLTDENKEVAELISNEMVIPVTLPQDLNEFKKDFIRELKRIHGLKVKGGRNDK